MPTHPDVVALADAAGLPLKEAQDRALAVGVAALRRMMQRDVVGVKLSGGRVVGSTAESVAALLDLGCKVVAREVDAAGPFLVARPAPTVSIGAVWPWSGESGGVSVTVHDAGHVLAAGLVRDGEPLPPGLARVRERFDPVSFDAAMKSALRSEGELRSAATLAGRSRRFPVRFRSSPPPAER